MSVEQRKPRPTHFPTALWDRIDRDATLHRRSSVKHMEYLLSTYYELIDAKALHQQMEKTVEKLRRGESGKKKRVA